MNSDILISTDKTKINIEATLAFLQNSYWGKNYTFESLRHVIETSLCFGLYINEKQIGFTRVITDYERFAYLADVVIEPGYQHKGYGKKLLSYVFNYPEVKKVSKWMLGTDDASGLYAKFGFVPLEYPQKYMEKRTAN